MGSYPQTYYASLYSDDHYPQATDQGKAFLHGVQLPLASPEQLQLLNADISEEEVQNTIRGLSSGKAPGPDGFSGEFYKTLLDQVSAPLAQY